MLFAVSVVSSAAGEAVFHVVQEPGGDVELAVDTAPKLCVELLDREWLVELGDDSDEVGRQMHLFRFQFLSSGAVRLPHKALSRGLFFQ